MDELDASSLAEIIGLVADKLNSGNLHPFSNALLARGDVMSLCLAIQALREANHSELERSLYACLSTQLLDDSLIDEFSFSDCCMLASVLTRTAECSISQLLSLKLTEKIADGVPMVLDARALLPLPRIVLRLDAEESSKRHILSECVKRIDRLLTMRFDCDIIDLLEAIVALSKAKRLKLGDDKMTRLIDRLELYYEKMSPKRSPEEFWKSCSKRCIRKKGLSF
jgi:hypothetical protein